MPFAPEVEVVEPQVGGALSGRLPDPEVHRAVDKRFLDVHDIRVEDAMGDQGSSTKIPHEPPGADDGVGGHSVRHGLLGRGVLPSGLHETGEDHQDRGKGNEPTLD